MRPQTPARRSLPRAASRSSNARSWSSSNLHYQSAQSRKLPHAAGAGRCERMIEDAHLGQQCRLVPIDMLVRHFAVFKADDGGDDKLRSPPGGAQRGKEPVHLDRVRKTYDHFLDEAITADRLR